MASLSPLSRLSPVDQSLFYSYGVGRPRSTIIPIIHHAIEKHARQQPDAIAVEHLSCKETLTFRELEAHSNRLAHALRSQGVGPGRRVCILARRSLELIVGIVGILKSGAQYVPLDAQTITDETLRFVLEDSKPSIVLVMADYSHRVHGTSSIILESIFRPYRLLYEEVDPVEDLSSPDDGAYIIYTSGTTGRPKGVDVRHRGVTNVISGPPGNVGMEPGMRVAQLLNIAFDMGAWEILGSLYNGCTLCLRGNTSKEWAALLKTVHVVIATPSMLAPHEPENYPTIRHVIVGGEPCPQALADKWAQYTNFNNCCGPTEISICNTVQRHTPGYPLSIGTPIPNTNVYILSRDPTSTTPVPIGDVGCMWVGGIGVSKGYLNLPDKTAERWRIDPFVGGGTGMMFNTGDLGRWRRDGQLDHMGRQDDQVKVKGFRVELDGVSASMRTLPTVKSAVTLLIESELWGFVTPATVDLDLLRAAVARSQPSYAVPKHYYALEDFPLTSNGKVDKRILRSLVQGQAQQITRPTLHHYSSWSSDVGATQLSEKTRYWYKESAWWRWLGVAMMLLIMWFLLTGAGSPSGF
ncbi:Adenylate-forming reductase 06235 [Psilocybe cubensis]|uniref:Adenylate-forming reductase 06235 n=2 Tax=Psilocybe cubensis TaxID=181762 RepID=A0ACB8GIS9_PSICU|nr:Adenylate-forming reductase 06235 [Psilocybe cubensis]KAH9475581.1 Adenylate-forming reductase 06235 [Psilocybe cubensis]